MCAIIDASVVRQAFGRKPVPAAIKFINWIDSRKGRLTVGGSKVRKELEESPQKFKEWALEAIKSGKMRNVNDSKVDRKMAQLVADGNCKSDDEHVIALAQVGGARLLYSNDRDLQQDFGDKSLIDRPRGKVYSTRKNKNFTHTHQRLLRLKKRDLCGVPQ